MIPLDKPHRDPVHCTSERPISLISALPKALEAVVLYRLLVLQERVLGPHQSAYGRDRGAETPLLELYDSAKEPRGLGKFIYITSMYVDAAFGNVPRSHHMKTVGYLDVDSYISRYFDTWLRERISRMRLMTLTGCFFSGLRGIFLGAPQGGVLPPFLGLAHIHPVISRFVNVQQTSPETMWSVEKRMLPSKDGVACVLAHEQVTKPCDTANATAAV